MIVKIFDKQDREWLMMDNVDRVIIERENDLFLTKTIYEAKEIE